MRSLPHCHADTIHDVHELLDVCLREAAAEVASRRGVRDGPRPECAEERDVVASQLDVIQHLAAAQQVVRDVENMVGLAVGPVAIQDLQLAIDGTGQTDSVRELMHDADAAAGDRLDALARFVARPICGELRPLEAGPSTTVKRAEPRSDFSLSSRNPYG